MTSAPHPQKKPWLALALLAVAICIAWTLLVYTEVSRQASRQDLRKADAIVVFGAAEYYGHPSAVFRARLDHAYVLFQRGFAPLIVITGGAADVPRYSEGGVGRDYLIAKGVPDENIIAETQSSDTSESAKRVGAIFRANDLHSCLAVSDGYHMFRVIKMLQKQGIIAYPSPRPDSRVPSRWARVRVNLREVAGYTAWKLGLG
jgi:uncharacterized SAM-binding protein YcdF (DUF218 family)